MHIWISVWYNKKGEQYPAQWSGRAVLCWKDGDEHAGAAPMPSLLLVAHELSDCHPETTIYSEEQSIQYHHHFPRRLMAIVCMSDKQSVHIISLLVFSLLQPESMHLRGGPKALSAYNLVSNTVFLFKLCKREASSHLSSAESTAGSKTN